MLLIEWSGYPSEEEWTWEYEEDLTKCYEIVSRYRKTQLDLSSSSTPLKPIGGADLSIDPTKLNTNNWVDLKRILEVSNQFLKHERYRSTLELVIEDSENYKRPINDSLIVLLYNCHFYSILWIAKEEKAFTSDGANIVLKEDILRELEAVLNIKLTAT